MPVQWTASMISPAEDLTGAPLLRREVKLDPGHGAVASAWLHASSLGVFEAYRQRDAGRRRRAEPGLEQL